MGAIPACVGEPPAGSRRRRRRRGVYPACAGEPIEGDVSAHAAWVYPRVCGGAFDRLGNGLGNGGLSPRVRGNPNTPRSPLPPRQVYPRVCGGTAFDPHLMQNPDGLSPRVRGNPLGSTTPVRTLGSIPACAGEPHRDDCGPGRHQVYPRVCGGTVRLELPANIREGLSPRVRGNPGFLDEPLIIVGSIPACAGEPHRDDCGPGRHQVYPRVCGGTEVSTLQRYTWTGLSPRVRGNPDECLRIFDIRGSIPACAGEPARAGRPGASCRVYPRVCGGTPAPSNPWRRRRGLSPRVRGNPQPVIYAPPPPGSIPACAGEPIGEAAALLGTKVYPRVCGGTLTACALPQPWQGLSPRVRGNLGPHRAAGLGRRSIPRVRGNLYHAHDEAQTCRSIPACAGEPTTLSSWRTRPAVYPRVCGGTLRRQPPLRRGAGLSPRVRGNPDVIAAGVHSPGSIPACAGEPRPGRLWGRCRQVYPRVCGGTIPQTRPPTGGQGLSPRVRGNLQKAYQLCQVSRSIPACAGEPAGQPPAIGRREVYPRVCGGTSQPFPCAVPLAGLSPRVRGNPQSRHRTAERRRSIPACAGEPRPHRRPVLRRAVYPRVCGGTYGGVGRGSGSGGLSPRVRGNPTTAWPE